MLKALKWELCPETVISWLKLYIQVYSLQDDADFLVPQFSQETFIQITQVSRLMMVFHRWESFARLFSNYWIFSSQLLDLCILDINCLDYQYGVLAAAAFCHFTSFETVYKVSGK